jgi:hypothetical protein
MARYSATEREIVHRKADTASLSVNGYIRAVTLGSDYKPPVDPEMRQTLLALKHELTAQGNNLNQVAKHLNSNPSPLPSILRAIKPLAEAILKTLDRVRAVLCGGQPAP